MGLFYSGIPMGVAEAPGAVTVPPLLDLSQMLICGSSLSYRS